MFLTCPCGFPNQSYRHVLEKQGNLSMGFTSVDAKTRFSGLKRSRIAEKAGVSQQSGESDSSRDSLSGKVLWAPNGHQMPKLPKYPRPQNRSKPLFQSHPVDRFLQAYRQVSPENSDASSSSPVRNETPQPSHYTQQILHQSAAGQQCDVRQHKRNLKQPESWPESNKNLK